MPDAIAPAKFADPHVTAKGEPRAHVPFEGVKTLWFNTGSLCNITCAHCYIESSPTADHLVYLTLAEVEHYLDELDRMDVRGVEIGFTGGEPFLNRDTVAMARAALRRGHTVLILTNAMAPMMRESVRPGLEALIREAGDRLTIRVSLDHPDRQRHDEERGAGNFDATLRGVDWLSDVGARIALAGRTLWGEAGLREEFAALAAARGWCVDSQDPASLVLFPEMDPAADVPEITTACWGILDKSPSDVMCASSRMVVKRRGAETPSVLACTLVWEDPAFDFGPALQDALRPVSLKHPHCARFCVLGGASCSR